MYSKNTMYLLLSKVINIYLAQSTYLNNNMVVRDFC